ncbi:endonuclease/exonuclease/phosphatase family protein [candidate division KSB1 bacterium]
MEHGRISPEIAKGLKVLRKRIKDANIPSSVKDKTVNIATWNIREFGRKKRKKESIHYIAEIFNQFDLIAVTELRRNLTDYKKVLDILGPYWKTVFSDYITDRGGNKERMAYLYDKRQVAFTGMASELDASRKKNRKTGEYLPEFSWWRSPFIASFISGSFDFVMISAHIRWGSGDKARIKPLELLAKTIDKRRKDKYGLDRDIILLGDFNIPKMDDDLYRAITSKGLKAPDAIRGLDHGSNLAGNKRYDQILHYPSESKSCFTNKAGVLDFFRDDHKALFPGESMTKREFTYQLSDHLPLWIQMNVDTIDEKLDQIINSAQ